VHSGWATLKGITFVLNVKAHFYRPLGLSRSHDRERILP
jgi:hypothetical protein